MVVEHHIAHAEPFDCVNQTLGFGNQMGFGTDLHAQVGHHLRAVGLHRCQNCFAMIWPALRAFPAPALGKVGCGYAVA